MKNHTSFILCFAACIAVSACLPIPDGPGSDLPPPAATFNEEEVQDIVDTYIKLTLGGLPGSNIDYEMAKTLMTPDFASEFTTPMFIPATYCIQDGPEDIRITGVSFNEDMNWAEATVVGAYHGGWQDMWKFTVVPVEGDGWLINEIECI